MSLTVNRRHFSNEMVELATSSSSSGAAGTSTPSAKRDAAGLIKGGSGGRKGPAAGKRGAVSASKRAGLVVPPSYMRRMVRVHGPRRLRIQPLGCVALAAFVQEFVAEVLRFADEDAHHEKRRRIQTKDVSRAIDGDRALRELYGKWLCVPKGGVLRRPKDMARIVKRRRG